MKLLYVGFMLLCALMLVCTTTAMASTAPPSNTATHHSQTVASEQASAPAPSNGSQHTAILSRAEADSLSIQSDSLLCQLNISDLKVGEIDGTDLIYVLVVVLLVVVILAVAR